MVTLHHVILVKWKPLPQMPFPAGFCVRMGHEGNWGELWKVGTKQQPAMFMLRAATSVQARLQLTPLSRIWWFPLLGPCGQQTGQTSPFSSSNSQTQIGYSFVVLLQDLGTCDCRRNLA